MAWLTPRQYEDIGVRVSAAGGPGPALAEAGGPSSPVNRAQFAVQMADMLGLDTSDTKLASSTFKDVGNLTPRQLGAVSALMAAGIIKGTSAETFSPSSAMQRGHVVTMFERAGMDASTIITKGRLGDPLLGSEATAINDGRVAAALKTAGLPSAEENLAKLSDPLRDPRYAAYLAGAGAEKNEIDNSLALARAQATARLDLANTQLKALQAEAETSLGVYTTNADASRRAAMEQAAARLAQVQQEAEGTIARADEMMDARLQDSSAIFGDRRNLAQRDIFQDFESRGFFNSTARTDSRDRAFNTLNLQQQSQDMGSRQAFLNTELEAKQQVAGAQTTYGNTGIASNTAYQNTLRSAQDQYATAKSAYQRNYENTYLSNTQGVASEADSAARQQAELARRTVQEEIAARSRLTQTMLDRVGT